MRHYTIMTIAAIAVSLFLNTGAASAHRNCNGDWKEKIRSEKVAFLTMELDLTPEEAQVFWPVYNQVEADKDQALHDVIKAHKAMEQAVSEGKSAKQVSQHLEAFLDAQARQNDVEEKSADRYESVLPVEKVAKLYLAEEKFRRQHIRKLHEKHGEKKQ